MWVCLRVGAVLVSAGAWVRVFLEVGDPTWCLVGSSLGAIGNIFILNTPSKVAINWFGPKQVGLISVLGVVATLISATAGAALPGFFIDKKSSVSDIKTFLII